MGHSMLSLPAFFLAALSEVLYSAFSGETAAGTAKETILGAAAAAAVVWCLLMLLCVVLFPKSETKEKGTGLSGLLLALIAYSMLRTVWQLAVFYRTQFGTGLLWLGLVLLLFFQRLSVPAVQRTAWAVGMLSLAAGILLVCGLAGQFQWTRLSFAIPAATGIGKAFCRCFLWIPEYFLIPLSSAPKKLWRLPIGVFLVQGALAMGAELIFGPESSYPARELLRAWGFGAFSRIDTLAAGLWLLLALFRLLWLRALAGFLVRQAPHYKAKNERRTRNDVD